MFKFSKIILQMLDLNVLAVDSSLCSRNSLYIKRHHLIIAASLVGPIECYFCSVDPTSTTSLLVTWIGHVEHEMPTLLEHMVSPGIPAMCGFCFVLFSGLLFIY